MVEGPEVELRAESEPESGANGGGIAEELEDEPEVDIEDKVSCISSGCNAVHVEVEVELRAFLS